MSTTAEEMQEEQIRKEFDLAEEVAEQAQEKASEEQEVPQEEEAEPQLSKIEIEAREMGHVSKEEWVASGRDEDEWTPPREYVKYGKLQRSMHQKLSEQERKTQERIDNLNKYHEAQRKIEINNLKQQQRQAVSEADTEEFDRLQKQIDAVESAGAEEPKEDNAPQVVDPVISEWEQKNPWIFDVNDNRAILAKAKFAQYTGANPNTDMASAIEYVDTEIAKAFPKQNLRREAARPTTETTTRKTEREPRKLTMNDLTFEEKAFWNQAGNSLYEGNQDKFLQAVADSRKGAK